MAGYLCCSAGFEWSRMWDFSPVGFRFGVTFATTLGFWGALSLTTEKTTQRSPLMVLLLAWAAVVPFPLITQAWILGLALCGLSILLGFLVLSGRARWMFLASVVLAAICVGLGLLQVTLGSFLLVGAALADEFVGKPKRELQRRRHQSVSQASAEVENRVEVSWRGFAQLYSVCASGEGEKFSRRVLSDTVSVIQRCGGVLQSGSEHRGVYRFPDQHELLRCKETLLFYEKQLEDVLAAVDAPSVRLIFKEL